MVGSVLWVAAMSLPLAARRLQPEIVALVASATFIVGGVVPVGDALFSNICLFVAIYTVGAGAAAVAGDDRARRHRRGHVRVALLGLVYYSAVQDYLPDFSARARSRPTSHTGSSTCSRTCLLRGAWYFGDIAYRSAQSRAELSSAPPNSPPTRAHARPGRRDRAAAHRPRAARRRRPPRVGDRRAGGCRAPGARQGPGAAVASLSAIEESARNAVDELHGLLGTLRRRAGPVAHRRLTRRAGRPDHVHSRIDRSTTRRRARRPGSDALACRRRPPGVAGRSSSAPTASCRRRSPTCGSMRARGHAEVRVRWRTARSRSRCTPTTACSRAAADQVGCLRRRRSRSARHARARRRHGGALETGPRARGGYRVRARFPLRRGEEVARVTGVLVADDQ